MSDLSWLNPTPHAIAVRFAANVAVDHATLATKRTLLLTWAGLPPAGSHQLCLAHSLDHLVGAGEQRGRDFQAERLGGLQIKDELDFRGLLDRQIGRFLTLQNPTDVNARQTVHICNASPIAHQSSGLCKLPPIENGGNFIAFRQANKLIASAE